MDWPENDYHFELPEDTFEGDNIPVPLPNGTAMQVFASDPDDPETDNARVAFDILPSSAPDDARNIFYVSSAGQDNSDSQLKMNGYSSFWWYSSLFLIGLI